MKPDPTCTDCWGIGWFMVIPIYEVVVAPWTVELIACPDRAPCTCVRAACHETSPETLLTDTHR